MVDHIMMFIDDVESDKIWRRLSNCKYSILSVGGVIGGRETHTKSMVGPGGA